MAPRRPSNRQLRRKLKAAQRSAIARADERSERLFVGRIRALATPLRAPLTERPCVYFETKVSTPDYDGGWQENVRDSAGVSFLLEDDSGESAIVDLSFAWVLVELERVATPPESFFATHRIDRTATVWGQTAGALRSHFEEGRLSAGDRVAVLGRGVREPDPEGAARAPHDRTLPPMRVRISGAKDHRIVVCAASLLADGEG